MPVRTHFRQARPGDYQPTLEVHTFSTQAKIRQVRRLQSLSHLVSKPHWTDAQQQQAIGLWSAILRSQAFDGNFCRWAQHIPEIGPLPLRIPTHDMLCTITQIAKHETDHCQWVDRKRWLDKLEFRRRLDFKCQGNSRAFARLRDPTQSPVTELHQNLQDECILVPQSDGQVVAYSSVAARLRPDQLVQVDDTTATILQQDEHSVTLRMHAPLPVTEEATLLQTQVLTHPSHIMHELQQYWTQHWNLPPSSLTPLPGFEDLVNSLPNLLAEETVDFASPELWRSAVKELNPRSARGIDAISAAELQSLPDVAIDHLASILMQMSEGFPDWCMIARTTPVPKTSQSLFVHQFRPITILAQTYRLWSKVITKGLLQVLSTKMPSQITGFLPGRGPADAMYHQQFQLECAHQDNKARSGVSIDLKRCFNTIWREGAARILGQIGVPPPILQIWQKSLQRLSRTWNLQGLNSPPQLTTNGLPEGDPFSVTAMIAIGYTWVHRIQGYTAQTDLSAFADNWGWSTTQVFEHSHVLTTTVDLAKHMRLIVDWDKSWLWSTHKSQIPALKRAITQVAPIAQVEEQLNAMELGAQITYRGSIRLGKIRARLDRAKARLQRLEKTQEPLESKTRLISAGVYPVAMYGMELVPLGSQHITTLRTAVVNAVLGPSISRNSTLALHCMPQLLDPQLVLIQRVLLAARRYLLRSDEATRDRFFRMVATHKGLAHECRGPAGCLRFYLDRFGWSLNPQGILQISAFIQCPFLHLGQSSMLKLSEWQWQAQVLEHADRKDWKGLPPISRAMTIQVLRQYNQAQQIKLLNEISGAYQTRVQQSAWDTAVPPECPHCGEIDTKQHRTMHCPALADLRIPHKETFQWIADTGSCMDVLPVIHVHEDHQSHLQLHWMQEEPQIQPQLHKQLQSFDFAGSFIQVYTDGSCQYPELTESRFASFAIVLDCAQTDRERQSLASQFKDTHEMPTTLKPLMCSRLQGLQDILRAELCAIIYICERYYHTSIHTDSAISLHLIHKVQNTTHWENLGPLPHLDLLVRLWQILRCGHRRFFKVKAHSEHDDTQDMLQLYHRLGNKAANDSAILANKHMLPMFARSLEQVCQEQKQQQSHLKNLFDFHLTVFTRMACLHKETQHDENAAREVAFNWDCLKIYKVDLPWTPPRLRLDWTHDCAWGPWLARQMVEWMREFRWPQTPDQVPHQSIGVSWYELVLSFMQYTKMFFPLRREDGKGNETLVTFKNRAMAMGHNAKFSEFAMTFSIFFLQITGLLSDLVWPKLDRQLVKAMFVQGTSFYTSGFMWRPEYPHQDWVYDTLAVYLRGSTGPPDGTALHALPSMDWELDDRRYQQLRLEMRGTWYTRSMATRRQMKKLRDWQQNPQGQLHF